MSYYHPSFSQTLAMTRGRGFSSSYRGSSNRSWGGDRGRGGFGSSSRGGSGRFSSFGNSFESRSKYPPPPSDRYSGSRGHSDDYHKSYRSEGPTGYMGRESHRSPERKRIRTEAPSSRRSHEGGFSGLGNNYNNSASRYDSSSSFSERRSFGRDRRPAPFSHRDEFRKPSGPPTSSSPRGGYRGRLSSRGSRGVRLREGGPRRRLVESSYAVRRRIAVRSSDYARRLQISRLRSAVARRSLKKSRSSEKDEVSDKEENWDEELDKKSKKEDSVEKTEKSEEDAEKKESPKKSPKKDDKSDKEDKKSDSETEQARKSRFIKLNCPHCNTRCVTFSKYGLHLQGSKHLAAMRRVAMKQKSILARMRLAQRNTQRELEKTTDDLAPRTNFCPLCKLNYKQPKATHQASDSHKNMKKFLMPYCKVCKITFKSPMLYETHICSIDHIKRKARSEMNGEKSDKDDSSNEEDNLENFMTIDSVGDVDDENESKKKETEAGKTTKEPINVGVEQIRKVEVHYCELCRMYLPRVEDNELDKTLSKHCKQRTHMQRYIRYKEDKDLASRAERLQRKELAEKEREKNKDKDDDKDVGEKEEGGKKAKENKAGEDKEKTHSAGDEDDIQEDKLWADVDKDLGDILAEAASGNKSSDEDDDSHVNAERYDRFRYSEKNEDDKKSKVDEVGKKEESGQNKEDKIPVEDK